MNEERYEKQPAANGARKVVYTSTGQVVTMDGHPLNDMDEREANKVVGHLDEGVLVPTLPIGREPISGPTSQKPETVMMRQEAKIQQLLDEAIATTAH